MGRVLYLLVIHWVDLRVVLMVTLLHLLVMLLVVGLVPLKVKL